jgi:peptide chain release factor subunit 1
MLQSTDLIGVISIDSEECGVGIIDGEHCYPIKVITSGVTGKSGKGGSSARRYERNREAELNMFFHRAAELANSILLSYGNQIKKVVVSGPGFTKDDFLAKQYLDYRLRAKLAPPIDIEYSGADGIYQTLGRITYGN